METHVINCSEGSDLIDIVAPAPGDSLIYNGLGGDDVFIVNAGVSQTTIYGTNGEGYDAERQWDTIQLLGSAQLDSIVGIDVLTFASTGPATTLTYNANSAFGVSQVVGSSAGANTIHFTSASEPVDLDISKVQFVNWSRPDQTIVVDLNTDTTVALDDRFVGSAVNERVTAGNGRDLLYGNGGDDWLDGGNDIDVLDGGDGNDTLIGGGGEGPNILLGGKGNDVYKFRDKVDIVIDSGGLDSRVVSKSTTLSSKEKFEGLVADWDLSTGKSVSLTGTSKANILIGHDGRNTLKGLAGNDILEGRGGNDQLVGDAGNDSLSGGLGNDVLTGGAGKDTFIFDTALGPNVDKIVGFQARQDKIALDHDTFTALGVDRPAPSAFSIGKAAKDASNTIIYDNKTGALYYDADGSGAGAAIKFAQLDKNLKLSASDFLVI